MTDARKPARTPGPWYTPEDSATIRIRVDRNPSQAIVQCVMRDGHIGEAQANAIFIVRACNAHDDLVAALRDSTAALRHITVILNDYRLAPDFESRLDGWMRRYPFQADKSSAALARATEGE